MLATKILKDKNAFCVNNEGQFMKKIQNYPYKVLRFSPSVLKGKGIGFNQMDEKWSSIRRRSTSISCKA